MELRSFTIETNNKIIEQKLEVYSIKFSNSLINVIFFLLKTLTIQIRAISRQADLTLIKTKNSIKIVKNDGG
jgi:hypothetical protein